MFGPRELVSVIGWSGVSRIVRSVCWSSFHAGNVTCLLSTDVPCFRSNLPFVALEFSRHKRGHHGWSRRSRCHSAGDLGQARVGLSVFPSTHKLDGSLFLAGASKAVRAISSELVKRLQSLTGLMPVLMSVTCSWGSYVPEWRRGVDGEWIRRCNS